MLVTVVCNDNIVVTTRFSQLPLMAVTMKAFVNNVIFFTILMHILQVFKQVPCVHCVITDTGRSG